MSFSAKRLRQALDDIEVALDGRVSGYCVALSGGHDSTALLHALAGADGAAGSTPLRALHVDHGIIAGSRDWARRSVEAASRCGVECAVLSVDVAQLPGASPEAAAREARYCAIARSLHPEEALLTAHHADDQLETSMLQLLRGGGLRGLSGMPRAARYSVGWHLRPLLGYTRDELAAWARVRGIEWVDDPSNEDRRYDRNYLRLDVLPRIRARWPAAAHTVSRVAAFAAEAVFVEEELSRSDLAAVADGETLSVARLAALSGPRQRGVVRHWLRSQGLAVPAASTLEALLTDVRRAAPDRLPVTRWADVAVHRYHGRLFAVSPGPTAAVGGACRPGVAYDLGGGRTLQWLPAVGGGLSRRRLPEFVQITLPEAAQRFRPSGTGFDRSLRHWLRGLGIVPWARDCIPVVMSGERVVAVGDLACSDEFAALADEESWQLHWSPRPRLRVAEYLAGDISGGGSGA